jgi:alkanesulfonate monooxygenase SsuD/methylene tetrahydromethanopterin reductase-like flavin-dependent oxidoreductase (luciferase family)
MPPFRFGVQLSSAASGAAWRETARTIEGLGYSTLFIPDHFEDQFGPLVALTVAAEATSSLKVGSLVFGNDYQWSWPRRSPPSTWSRRDGSSSAWVPGG